MQTNARAQGNKQTKANGRERVQTTTVNSKMDAKQNRTEENQNDREQMKTNCKKPQETNTKRQKYATTSKLTNANDHIPGQMMVTAIERRQRKQTLPSGRR